VEGIERACGEAKLSLKDIAAVGVGAPSAVDWDKGLVIHAGNLGWKRVPLRDILAKKLDRPVVVDNDVNVAAFGESRVGAGKGRGDLMAVWVGTGIGGGFVLNGKLWRGPLHTAGEIGHVIMFPGAGPGHRRRRQTRSRRPCWRPPCVDLQTCCAPSSDLGLTHRSLVRKLPLAGSPCSSERQ
jgi:predicted NBD/HSP70 family sugar kinase